MTELVAVDIGGTNARFAIATVQDDGAIQLGEVVTLPTHAYASLRSAWAAFAQKINRPLPRDCAISFAGPVDGAVLKLTNSPWVLRPELIPSALGIDRYELVNDFGAVAYAVSRLGPDDMRHLCGPDEPLGETGTISIVGPGTGLGVAQLHRDERGVTVITTEGGHIDFAPLDRLEDQMLERMRERYRRVSVERLVSGPGLVNLYEALAAVEGRTVPLGMDDKELWKLALSGSDVLASAALDRFCLALGSVAGDMTLAHGAWAGTVIAGGVGVRIADHLPISGFAGRYTAKGRFEARMTKIPVKLVTYDQPGLLGAAAAFAEKYCR
jgi:glucokinase